MDAIAFLLFLVFLLFSVGLIMAKAWLVNREYERERNGRQQSEV